MLFVRTIIEDDTFQNPLTRSQDFVTAICALIFIESDNDTSLVVLATALWSLDWRRCQRATLLSRRDSSCFGGSTPCLLFGPQVQLTHIIRDDGSPLVGSKVYVGKCSNSIWS